MNPVNDMAVGCATNSLFVSPLPELNPEKVTDSSNRNFTIFNGRTHKLGVHKVEAFLLPPLRRTYTELGNHCSSPNHSVGSESSTGGTKHDSPNTIPGKSGSDTINRNEPGKPKEPINHIIAKKETIPIAIEEGNHGTSPNVIESLHSETPSTSASKTPEYDTKAELTISEEKHLRTTF